MVLSEGLRCGIEDNDRDVMMLGDLQDSIRELCNALGWMVLDTRNSE